MERGTRSGAVSVLAFATKMAMSTHIRINVKGLVLNQCLSHVHDLGKNENIFEAVRDLLCDELNKIWHQLVQTWVLPKARVTRGAIIFAGFVQESATDLLEIKLEFP